MGKEGCNYSIESLKAVDIPVVVDLLKTESQAVVPLTPEEVAERADNGLFYVAKNLEGEVIVTQGVTIWPESGLPEVGSAVVKKKCRGQGIGTELKKVVIGVVQEKFPGQPIIGFTEEASQSRGILKGLGFKVASMVGQPVELFSACPKDEAGCFNKTKVDPPACGCIIFELKPSGGDINE